MLSTVYSGRILVINDEFKIIKDTYNLDEGKYALSEEVIDCFNGNNTTHYDNKNAYIELTSPIQNLETKKVMGVMLISSSTSEIEGNIDVLEQKGALLLLVICILVLVFGYILAGILVKPFARVTRSIEDLTGTDIWTRRSLFRIIQRQN